jgi:hypothetical protein
MDHAMDYVSAQHGFKRRPIGYVGPFDNDRRASSGELGDPHPRLISCCPTPAHEHEPPRAKLHEPLGGSKAQAAESAGNEVRRFASQPGLRCRRCQRLTMQSRNVSIRRTNGDLELAVVGEKLCA